MSTLSRGEVVCELLWALGRRHAWSGAVTTEALVRDIDVSDEKRGRGIAREELPMFDSILYQQGSDRFQLDVPHDDVKEHLKNNCPGYSDLRVDATFK